MIIGSGNVGGILAESEGGYKSLGGGGGGGGRGGGAIAGPAGMVVSLGDLLGLLVSKAKTNEH